jgi:hypothetical protein
MDIQDILFQIILDLVNSNYTNWLTLIILTLTFLYVRKYTITAQKQTDELIKQRKLTTLPSLTIHDSFNHLFHSMAANKRRIDKEHPWVSYLEISLFNVGNGISLNNSIQIHSPCFNNKSHFVFDPISIIPKDQNQSASGAFIFSPDVKTEDEATDLLNLFKKQETSIIFTFQDIEGNNYQQESKWDQENLQHGIVKNVIINKKVSGIKRLFNTVLLKMGNPKCLRFAFK